jgi:hypothetical protein
LRAAAIGPERLVETIELPHQLMVLIVRNFAMGVFAAARLIWAARIKFAPRPA